MNILQHLRRYFPILDWIKDYSGYHFKGDINAGLTVAVMLIPQGMAYAVLAGLPPIYGLYASIVPLIIYAIFGTSRQLAVGPVAMVSLLVVTGIGEMAGPGSDRFIQLAILAALGVGLTQLLMGLFRMGFLVNFLSHPVLSGFTSAAALIIGFSQLKGLLGMDLPRSNYVHEIIYSAYRQISTINMPTAVIGIGAIALLLVLKRWKPAFPSALAAVVLGTVATALFGLNEYGVSVVGDIPKGLPGFSTPAFSMEDFRVLIPTILAISLVGYMESIAVAKAIANKRGYRIDANQELIGLGMANIAGSIFQSYPTTGGLSRTAVNDQAGAKTGLAAIISAILLGLTVMFLTPLFYYLPQAVLASIIIVAVAGLFEGREALYLWRTDRRDFLMMLVTFIATLTLGIEEGIGVGVIISLGALIYSSTRPHSTELGRLDDSDNFRNINRYDGDCTVYEDILIFRFDAPLYFVNVTDFREKLESLIRRREQKPKQVILDAASINNIDSTGLHMLHRLINELRDQDIDFNIAGAIGPVRDKLQRSGITEKLGNDHFFFDVAHAVSVCDGNGKQRPAGHKLVTQVNR